MRKPILIAIAAVAANLGAACVAAAVEVLGVAIVALLAEIASCLTGKLDTGRALPKDRVRIVRCSSHAPDVSSADMAEPSTTSFPSGQGRASS